MKNTSRGFAHILLILVVLLGVGALGYYKYAGKSNVAVQQNAAITITSTPMPISEGDRTPHLKTYTNTEFKFSFDYPENFHYKETDERSKGGSFHIALAPDSEQRDLQSFHLVQISINDDARTLDRIITSGFCDQGRCAKQTEARDIKIGGNNGKLLTNPPGPLPSNVAISQWAGATIQFTIVYDDTYNDTMSIEEKKRVFDNILSTFKFN